MCESHGCISVASVMAVDIIDTGTGANIPPEPMEGALGFPTSGIRPGNAPGRAGDSA